MEEDVIATEHKFSARFHGGSQMQCVVGGQMLLFGEIPGSFSDRLSRSLALAANPGKAQHFYAPFWKRT
jgi:hypothetical protein